MPNGSARTNGIKELENLPECDSMMAYFSTEVTCNLIGFIVASFMSHKSIFMVSCHPTYIACEHRTRMTIQEMIISILS